MYQSVVGGDTNDGLHDNYVREDSEGVCPWIGSGYPARGHVATCLSESPVNLGIRDPARSFGPVCCVILSQGAHHIMLVNVGGHRESFQWDHQRHSRRTGN